MILNFSILHGRFVSTSQIENQLQVLISHAREWQKSENTKDPRANKNADKAFC